MGRRSPGRSGGRGPPTPGAPCGRGRWKIGWPGTGRPGAGRIVLVGAAPCATGAGGRGGGALYTGRGPVCGTIIRGAGVCGAAVTDGVAGRTGAAGGAGATGAADAVTGGTTGVVGGGATTATGGTGGAAGRGIGGAGGGATTAAGFSTTGGATTGRTGGAGGGVTDVGAATTGAGGFGDGTATTGFGGIAGAAGRTGAGGAAAASFFCVIAFSTSPGREMCDKSILVLISSSPRRGRDVRADDVCDSPEPRR